MTSLSRISDAGRPSVYPPFGPRTDRMGGLAKPASMASIGNYRTRTEVGVVGGAVSGVAGEAPLVSVARARDFKGTANGSLDLQKLQSLGYMQGPGGTFMSNITPNAIEGSGGFNTPWRNDSISKSRSGPRLRDRSPFSKNILQAAQ